MPLTLFFKKVKSLLLMILQLIKAGITTRYIEDNTIATLFQNKILT